MTSFWRRQRLLIDRLQFRLMAINLLYLATLSLVFATAMFGPHVYTLYSRGASVEDKNQAAETLLLLHGTIWPPLILVALIFLYHSMVYSHRIAGPLYRFRKVFEQVAEGDLRTRAVIRTPDYLHREADALNAMVESLSERVDGIAGCLDEVQVTVWDVRAAFRGGAGELPLAGIERLEARLAAVQELLGGFRFESTGPRSTSAPESAPVPSGENAPTALV